MKWVLLILQETQELRQKAEQTAFELAQEKDELTAEVSTD